MPQAAVDRLDARVAAGLASDTCGLARWHVGKRGPTAPPTREARVGPCPPSSSVRSLCSASPSWPRGHGPPACCMPWLPRVRVCPWRGCRSHQGERRGGRVDFVSLCSSGRWGGQELGQVVLRAGQWPWSVTSEGRHGEQVLHGRPTGSAGGETCRVGVGGHLAERTAQAGAGGPGGCPAVIRRGAGLTPVGSQSPRQRRPGGDLGPAGWASWCRPAGRGSQRWSGACGVGRCRWTPGRGMA